MIALFRYMHCPFLLMSKSNPTCIYLIPVGKAVDEMH